MTTREFYQAVVNANVSDEMTEKATELLNAMDTRNEKRKSADTKEKKETRARLEKVIDFFKSAPKGEYTRDDVAASIESEITLGQITSACSALVRDGVLVKSEVKIDKKTKTAYSLVEN